MPGGRDARCVNQGTQWKAARAYHAGRQAARESNWGTLPKDLARLERPFGQHLPRRPLYRGRSRAAGPYFVLRSTGAALVVSILATLLALLVFGYVKGTFTVKKPLRSAWQTALVGGLAAAAAFGIAKLIA